MHKQKGNILIILLLLLAGAGFVFMGYKYVFPKISQVIPTPTVIPTSDPTTDWKTYTNTKYNFSVKYPKTWEIATDINNAPVTTNILQENLNFEVIILDKTRELMCGPYACYPSVQINTPIINNGKIKLSLKNWTINYIKSKSPDMELDPAPNLEELKVDEHEAIKYNNTVFTANNNYVYLINFDASGSSGGANTSIKINTDTKAVFNQILSTFKFINQ